MPPDEPVLVYCDACHVKEGVVHVTMTLSLFSMRSIRTKIVQFWLCEECERKNRILVENTAGQSNRVARALTPTPSWWRPDQSTKLLEDNHERDDVQTDHHPHHPVAGKPAAGERGLGIHRQAKRLRISS